tara:strand:- start:992 stop:2188 length:1197 start_codon:yes stop_codon:yes gene_type:complete
MFKGNNNLEYLVGSSSNKISEISLTPYEKGICNFLGDFSKELNKDKNTNKFPDVKALAFWCRKQKILDYKKNFSTEKIRLGLGLIFHITPSNIPTNFAYSLIFGLITGNSNIVKVPSKNFEQVNIICKAINKLLKTKFKKLSKMITIVRYNSNENFTKEVSSKCNARIIWGGDKTIKDIRKYPLNVRSFDITFADRYSFCVINSNELVKLKKSELKRLSERFYNDTYQVDQNACSSPHLILWEGNKIKSAKKIFWKSVKETVSLKYELSESVSMEKYTQLCKEILNNNNIKKVEKYGNYIYTISLKKIDKNLHNLRGKWGLFFEYDITSLNIIKNYINSKYQTLTYWGLKREKLENFIKKNCSKGIDRIVPIGQALDINFFWDGYDLNKVLTRVIDLK